jgi:phage shock protein A
MGIFSRLTDIINSNLNAMLDKAEDPEKMVRLIIQEMEDTLVEIRSTSVRTIARKKEIQRHMAGLRQEAAEWERKAELAISKDREDLARAALEAKNRLLDRLTELEKELAHIDGEIAKLDEDTGKLKAKLADARQRQKTMVLRQTSVASRLRAKQQVNDQRMTDTLMKMEQYEGKIDRMEAELESYDLGSRTLADEFTQLETGQRVESELRQLKERLGKGPDAPQTSGASKE